MTGDRSAAYLQGLVRELCRLPGEMEWVEFKVNNTDPEEIGEYISALANAAALAGKAAGYLLWGVKDGDHEIVGTRFDPTAERRGNEELENWLLRMLSPRIDFRFYTVDMDRPGADEVPAPVGGGRGAWPLTADHPPWGGAAENEPCRHTFSFDGHLIEGGIDKADRIRACYLHACLRYVQQDYLNASLRGASGFRQGTAPSPRGSITASG